MILPRFFSFRRKRKPIPSWISDLLFGYFDQLTKQIHFPKTYWESTQMDIKRYLQEESSVLHTDAYTWRESHTITPHLTQKDS